MVLFNAGQSELVMIGVVGMGGNVEVAERAYVEVDNECDDKPLWSRVAENVGVGLEPTTVMGKELSR